MTNLEFHYPEGDDEIKGSTGTPDVIEGAQQAEEPKKSSSLDVENASPESGTTTPEVIGEEEATEMVDSFLNDPETPVALSNLRIIEEKHKSGSLPANIEARYTKAKDKAKLALKNDIVFQQALAQAGVNLEGFSSTDNSEKRESDAVDEMLKNKSTKEQLKVAKTVIKEKYKTLDPKQQKSLEEGLQVFKTSIKNAADEIGIDQ